MVGIASSVADLGSARDVPPSGPNFFILMQFSGKIGQIIGWRPLHGWHPLGNPGSATARNVNGR